MTISKTKSIGASPIPTGPRLEGPDGTAPTEGNAAAAKPSSGAANQGWAPNEVGSTRSTEMRSKAAAANVSTLKDVEALRADPGRAGTFAANIKAALLSQNPEAVRKAAGTLQIAESYQRKAMQDSVNYRGTGFRAFEFPKLSLDFDETETQNLIDSLKATTDTTTTDIVAFAERTGLVRTVPPDAIQTTPHLASRRSSLRPDAENAPGRLRGSQGVEVPRGAPTFEQEWKKEVLPGIENIERAIQETHDFNLKDLEHKYPDKSIQELQAMCPYAHGNHAKGISFDNLNLKVDEKAPVWAKELFGEVLQNGKLRVSGSQTNPNQPDSASHMPGLRIVFEEAGIDLTANPGDTTHANTARKHTEFTQDISVPKDGLSDSTAVRAAKHAADGLFEGRLPRPCER